MSLDYQLLGDQMPVLSSRCREGRRASTEHPRPLEELSVSRGKRSPEAALSSDNQTTGPR